MTKIHNFQKSYDKGYKIFITDENLSVCILIYFNKTYILVDYKKYKNYKINYPSKYKVIKIQSQAKIIS